MNKLEYSTTQEVNSNSWPAVGSADPDMGTRLSSHTIHLENNMNQILKSHSKKFNEFNRAILEATPAIQGVKTASFIVPLRTNDEHKCLEYLTATNDTHGLHLIGGKSEKNECCYGCAVREFKEETGIDIHDTMLIPLIKLMVNGTKVCVFTLHARSPSLENVESQETKQRFEWLSMEQMLDRSRNGRCSDVINEMLWNAAI